MPVTWLRPSPCQWHNLHWWDFEVKMVTMWHWYIILKHVYLQGLFKGHIIVIRGCLPATKAGHQQIVQTENKNTAIWYGSTQVIGPKPSIDWKQFSFYKTFFVWNSLFIFTSCLLHHSHPAHDDQAKELVCRSPESRPIQAQELFTLVPHLFGITSRCLSLQPFQLLPSRSISRHISLTWPFAIDTSTPDGLSMLWNCFIDFALEYWFGYPANEPGFAGGIDTIEIWLIDWLIEMSEFPRVSNNHIPVRLHKQLLIVNALTVYEVSLSGMSWI